MMWCKTSACRIRSLGNPSRFDQGLNQYCLKRSRQNVGRKQGEMNRLRDRDAWFLALLAAVSLSVTTGLAVDTLPPPPQDPIHVVLPLSMARSGISRPYPSTLDGFDFMVMSKLYGSNGLERIGASPSFFISSSTTNLASNGREADFSSLELDQVERILDANTIQLKKKGIVRLAIVRMPSTTGNFQFPDCFTFSPSYKIRQLIPKTTAVRVQTLSSASSNQQPPAVILIREGDSVVINRELVKTGFAKVIKPPNMATKSNTFSSSIIDTNELLELQKQAQSKGLGIFARCDAESIQRGDGGGISKLPIVEAQFEPLERTMETVWTDDGGKRQLRTETSKDAAGPPANPGDVKGCSDFKTYEDALQWFERYEPYYGDVAKLDRDGDGVPCPGLPHTSDRTLYRMKVPKNSDKNGS
jgi:endonuclease YncB( thermonuclease family)